MKDKTMKRPLRVLLSWTLVFAVAAGSAVLGVLVGGEQGLQPGLLLVGEQVGPGL